MEEDRWYSENPDFLDILQKTRNTVGPMLGSSLEYKFPQTNYRTSQGRETGGGGGGSPTIEFEGPGSLKVKPYTGPSAVPWQGIPVPPSTPSPTQSWDEERMMAALATGQWDPNKGPFQRSQPLSPYATGIGTRESTAVGFPSYTGNVEVYPTGPPNFTGLPPRPPGETWPQVVLGGVSGQSGIPGYGFPSEPKERTPEDAANYIQRFLASINPYRVREALPDLGDLQRPRIGKTGFGTGIWEKETPEELAAIAASPRGLTRMERARLEAQDVDWQKVKANIFGKSPEIAERYMKAGDVETADWLKQFTEAYKTNVLGEVHKKGYEEATARALQVKPEKLSMTDIKSAYSMDMGTIKNQMMIEMTPDEQVNLAGQPDTNILALLMSGRIGKSLSPDRKKFWTGQLQERENYYGDLTNQVLGRKGANIPQRGAIPERPPTPGEQEEIWDLTDKPLPPLGPLDIGKKRRIKFRSKEGDIQTWDVIGETDKEGKRFWKIQRRLWE